MKYTDNYNAKFEIWAKESKVRHMPTLANVPRFGWKKFSSYEDFNAWKKSIVDQIALSGGAKWTS
jgi:hypothetical protein